MSRITAEEFDRKRDPNVYEMTPIPMESAQDMARRNLLRLKREEARKKELEKRRKELQDLANRQAVEKEQQRRKSGQGPSPEMTPGPGFISSLRDPNAEVNIAPTRNKVTVDGVEKTIDEAMADVDKRMELEQFIQGGRIKDRALRRARTEELIAGGMDPQKADAQAIAEQDKRREQFQKGVERSSTFEGKGASGFISKESNMLAQDVIWNLYGPAARAMGYPQEADAMAAFNAGIQADLEDWRNIESPYPRTQQAVMGAASNMAQMGIGAGASMVAGPEVGMAVMSLQYGAQEYNRAAYEGAEAGLAGTELRKYAETQAVIEATIMPIMNKIPGMGGIEGRVLRQALARNVVKHPTFLAAIKSGAKEFTRDTAAELVEEVLTETLHGYMEEKNLNRDVNYERVIGDTMLQTVLMMGLSEGSRQGSSAGTGLFNTDSLLRAQHNPEEIAKFYDEIKKKHGSTAEQPAVPQADQSQQPVAEPQPQTEPVPPLPPEVEEFLQNPSRKKYDKAVKAGLMPIEDAQTIEGRARYAAEIQQARSRFEPAQTPEQPAQPVETPQAQDQPVAPAPAPMEAQSGSVPDSEFESWVSRFYEDTTNEDQGNQRRQGNQEQQQGGEERLLEPPMMKEFLDTWIQDEEKAGIMQPGTDKTKFRNEFAGTLREGADKSVDQGEYVTFGNPGNKRIEGKLAAVKEYLESQGHKVSDPVYRQDSGTVAMKVEAGQLQPSPQQQATVPAEPQQIQTSPDLASPETSPDQPSPSVAGPVSTPSQQTEQAPEQPVRRRGEVGGMMSSGEVVQTASGRETTPFPKIATDTNRKLSMTLRKAEEWLRDNALLEAEARGDEFNALQFRNETPGKMPKATKDAMEEYLFGEQPEVQQGILKPMVSPETKPASQEPAVPWKRTSDETRVAYHKRLKKDGWTKAPKAAITVIDSPGRVKAESTEQLQKSPYKAGDRVRIVTGYAGEEMQTSGTVLEDTNPNETAVKIRTDKGKVHYVDAYYTSPVASSEQPNTASKPKRRKDARSGRSLRSIVLQYGGISAKSLSKDYSLNDLRSDGMLNLMRDSGHSLDELAQMMETAGYIIVPSNMTPGNYLLEQLKANADGAMAQYTDAEIEAQLEAERKAYEELRSLTEGRGEEESVDQLRQRSEAAGVLAANEGEPDEGELTEEELAIVDTSFNFGANVEGEQPAQAETQTQTEQPADPREELRNKLREAMAAELKRKEDEKAAKAKTKTPRAQRTKSETKTPRPKSAEKQTAEEKTQKAREKREAAAEAIRQKLKQMGRTTNAVLVPTDLELVKLVADYAIASMDLGIKKFSEFVIDFKETFGEKNARELAASVEEAWGLLPEFGFKVDPAGKVADVLGPETGDTNATGTTNPERRQEDQGTGTEDRGNVQDSTGTANADVLEGSPSGNDNQTETTGDTAPVRGGTGGTVRSGSGEVDSGGVDGTERSGTDSRGTTADDAGTGRDRAPQSTRPNYHLTNPDAIIGGGPKAKFERNRKAIEIVRDIESSGRAPTAEELDTLAGYMGWGAFGQELFQGSWENPRPKQGWEEQDEWLRIYLGEAEWKSAQQSIVNAHYTDPQTVIAMWDMLRRMGFAGGRVLEPSIGIGNFFSLMPRDLMERSVLTGIELDKITSKIAMLLHPQANIQQKGYQESQTPDNFYDLIISNVPFGDYPIADRRYKQDFSVHNYFFKRAFDQVKPGGVVAFLTSNMTMDGKSQAKLMRAQIAKEGDLVTAIRLPSGAFQAYAGTKVVADLIVIRKRKPGEQPAGDQNWIKVIEMETPNGKQISVNEYWQTHPENILGTMTWGHGTTSGRPGMIVNQPANLQESLDSAAASVPKDIINTEKALSEGKERPNTTAMRQNSVIAQDNELWIVKGEHLVPLVDVVGWYRSNTTQKTRDNNRKEIESLLGVREALRSVLDQQANSEDSTEARAELNRVYDAFVKKYGPIGESAAAKHLRKAGDPMGNTLLSIEKKVGNTYEKRPIFERSTVRQKRNIKSPTVKDAFAIERNRTLDLDMQRIADMANVPVADVIRQLEKSGQIYKTGNGTYDASDVFLSGNMARKLRQLEAAQKEGVEGLERSIEMVRSLIPEPVPYSQIEAKLGAVWIESSDYADFIAYLVNEPASRINVERGVTGWKVSVPSDVNSKPEATVAHGHPGVRFNKLVAAAMNNATVKVTVEDEDGNKVIDPEETAKANEKISDLREKFQSWIWTSPERITRLSSVYNEEFNSSVTPKFDEVPLDFEGMVIERGDKEFNLRSHQASAVWRGIVSGKGLFAHEVGTGKTLTMAALAMESRRLGLASKPLLLAHNANSLAVRNEIQEAYPSANILYVDNLDAKTKDATLQAIAAENWDLIVVPHSMVERFQLRPETVEALLKPEMDALEAAAREAYEESESSDYAKGQMPEDLDSISKEDMQALREPTAKELVKERLKLRARIDKAIQAMQKGTGVFFEDMGVDMVMVDEAHIFKKLPITSKQTIKGLNKRGSIIGTNVMMLADFIRGRNNGRGVYMFTGTPITNTINEIYNMMRFVMAEEMGAANLRDWDAWFNNFATQETLTELSSGGTWENFDRLSSFVNLPELRQMVGQYMDIVFADEMPEFKPRESRDGRTDNPVGRPYKQVHNEVIEMLPAQRELSAQLAQRYTEFKKATGKEKVRMMREVGGKHNPLVIEGEGVKLAMDPRLAGIGVRQEGKKLVTDTSVIDPKDPNLKINKMISQAMIHYWEHPQAAQMVFMQVGYEDTAERTVARDAAGEAIKQTFQVFNVAKEIKRRLMEEGVPEAEIAIFSDLSKEKRSETASLMKQGKVRFAIGSTETMGTGVNAQDELVAMHHLDAPWMPGDLEQRNGRGHRQGNKWNTVHEYRYLTEGPQDGRRWQVLLTKDKFIREFMRGDASARVIEMDSVDLSDDGSGTDMEQTFAAAAGDPRIMQRIRLEGQVDRLQRMKNSHAQTITETINRANRNLGAIKQEQVKIASLNTMHETWMANRTDTPELTIRGKKYTGAEAINDELKALEERYKNSVHPRMQLGEYRGLVLMMDNGSLFLVRPPVANESPAETNIRESSNDVDVRWSLNSLQGVMANLPERVRRMEQWIERDQQFIDMARKAVGEPFPKQKQLDAKKKQLDKLNEEMAKNPEPSPAWMRAGAPIGTDVFWKGKRYEVAGHRGKTHVLAPAETEGGEFIAIPAGQVTDADGTPLFPDIVDNSAVADTPVSELRKSADKARQELMDIQRANKRIENQFVREWKNNLPGGWGNRGRAYSGVPITDKMVRLIISRMLGAVRAGVKSFEVFILELRANLAESSVEGVTPEMVNQAVDAMMPKMVEIWNENRDKYGLNEAKAQPAATEPPAGNERLYSTKNAYTDRARERFGMEPRVPLPRQSREKQIEMAAEIGKTEAGRKEIDSIIAELATTPRATSVRENDLLNFRYAELDQKRTDALKEKIAARERGDDAQVAVQDVIADSALAEQVRLIELLSTTVSYALGSGLQARKALIKTDYTMARMVMEYEAAYGEKPSKQQQDAMQKMIDELNAANKALEEKLKELESKNDDLEKRLKEAHDGAVSAESPESPKKKSFIDRLAEEGKAQAARGFEKLKAMKGKLYSVETATAELIAAFSDIAQGYAKQGVVKLADFISRVREQIGEDTDKLLKPITEAWNQVTSKTAEVEQESITDELDITDDDSIGRVARALHSFVIRRDGLDASKEGREAAVDAVHAILSVFIPGFTGEQTARAMSGIGVYSELSKDDAEVVRRDQKAQLLLLEQIEDWKKGQAPPATGQERPPVSDEQRALRKLVNEAKKASGVASEIEGRNKSALAAAKRMAKNRIKDLDKAIHKRTPIKRSQKILQPDEELTKLQADRDALQKLYDETFGRPELNDEQKLARAEKMLDRAISKLESDLKSGKLYEDEKQSPLSSPALDAKRAQLEALKASREEMRIQSGEAQARSDAAYERHLREKDARLAQRIADGDFAPRPKKPERVLTPEATKLMLAVQKKQQQINEQVRKWEFDRKHLVYKAIMWGPVTTAAIIRKGLTSIDQSLIGRQGYLLGATNPAIYAKSIRKAFPSDPIKALSIFPTEQDLFDTQAALDADENWVRMEKLARLAVTDVHGGLNREEQFVGVPEWVNKIPGIGGSERAGSAFINTLRRLVFRSLVDKLSKTMDGKNKKISTADLRLIANMINIATGRGDIKKFAAALQVSSHVFFSPRWWLSRLQWLSGYPVWYGTRWFGGEGASTEARMLVAKEWGKQMGAQAAIMGFVSMMLYAMFGPPGDDEEWDVYYGYNHAKFGQIRIGNTYFDMTAGLGQHVSHFGRILSGKTEDRWEVKEKDKMRLAIAYGRGKLAPYPGMYWDYLDGKSMGYDKFGSPEWFASKFFPLSVQDVFKASKNEEFPLSAVASFAMFFGFSAQSYEAKMKSRTDAVSEIRAAQKQGKSQAEINDLMNKHFAEQAAIEAKEELRTADPERMEAIQRVIDGEQGPELEAAIRKEKGDLALIASTMLSTEDPRKDKSADGDKAIETARSLLKAIAPTYEEANELYTEGYKQRNGGVTEIVGGRRVVKKSVQTGRRRLKSLYKE